MTLKTMPPNYERDKKLLEGERRRSMSGDFAEKFWKPKPGDDNLIRILPARQNESGATYHFTAGKHFIKHPEDSRTEAFICMRETYGQRCPACEKYFELVKVDKKAAAPYKVKRFGVFNVIDRTEEDPHVRIYEAPRQAIWAKIVRLVTTRGRMSDILDEIEIDEETEEVNIISPGRDLLIIFNPNAEPQGMYAIYPTDHEPLGTPEQIVQWFEEMVDLLPQNIYGTISYEDAYVKTFGTPEERQALRDRWRDEQEVEEDEEEEEPTEESVEQENIEEMPQVEEKPATPKPAPKPKAKTIATPKSNPQVREKKVVEKASASKAEKEDIAEMIRQKVAKIKQSRGK